jgi:DeoR/GlpR family transcriptional regulator of sugar metabolism
MHDSLELPSSRRQEIADRLTRGQSVVAASLAQEFAISEDAIRRDLRALAAEGVCRRVYGGALPLSPAGAPMAVRTGENAARKQALALAAASLVGDGQTLFLDAGSTVLRLAALLPARSGLRVVTNSIPAAAALTHRTDVALYVIGGAVTPEIGACVAARALADLARFRIDLCFLGACALSPADGLAGFDMSDVEFKRALLAQSRATALMMTNDKLATRAPFTIGPVDALAHLVLEHDAPAETLQDLRRSGTTPIVAAPPGA